jgi:hypothetical protein
MGARVKFRMITMITMGKTADKTSLAFSSRTLNLYYLLSFFVMSNEIKNICHICHSHFHDVFAKTELNSATMSL